jgi:hypothetical protein
MPTPHDGGKLSLAVPDQLIDEIAARAAALVLQEMQPDEVRTSAYVTIPEAALYHGCGHKPCPGTVTKNDHGETVKTECAGDTCRRCNGTGQVVNRSRVDDLLSTGKLTRTKDGSRTLIARKELEDYLAGKPTGRAAR